MNTADFMISNIRISSKTSLREQRLASTFGLPATEKKKPAEAGFRET